MKIGGNKGSADGSLVLDSLMRSLISPEFLPKLSWTGRGKGKARKIPLNGYTNVINFITVIVMKADRKYSSPQVQADITYEVLKRAPAKFGKSKKRGRESSVSSESSVSWYVKMAKP